MIALLSLLMVEITDKTQVHFILYFPKGLSTLYQSLSLPKCLLKLPQGSWWPCIHTLESASSKNKAINTHLTNFFLYAYFERILITNLALMARPFVFFS